MLPKQFTEREFLDHFFNCALPQYCELKGINHTRYAGKVNSIMRELDKSLEFYFLYKSTIITVLTSQIENFTAFGVYAVGPWRSIKKVILGYEEYGKTWSVNCADLAFAQDYNDDYNKRAFHQEYAKLVNQAFGEPNLFSPEILAKLKQNNKTLEKEENTMEKTNVEIEIEIKENKPETGREVEVKDISQFITKVIADPKKKITVVIFMDGKKEVVKCAEEDEYDVYVGVSLAMTRRMFGTNSAFHKCVDEKTLLVEPKKKKVAKKPAPKAKPKAKKGSK